MIPKDGLNPQYLVAAFRRRFWYVVLPFFLIALAAVIYCIRAPKVYVSSTLILIQPQEVPTEYVKSTVTTDVQARISSISEQVMSRSKLEELITKYDLYPEMRAKVGTYGAVEEMREAIQINVKQEKNARRRGDEPAAFEVSFEGQKPARVRDVTSEIAKLFIDYNFRLRAEQAAGTKQFLERELVRMKEELRQKEETVRQFKEKYFGLLPEQMQNNYSILTRLQQQLDSINDTLQKTEDRKILLQGQLNKLESIQPAASEAGSKEATPLTLEQMRQKLQALKSRYSDKHPDVVRLTATIAKMEKEEQSGTGKKDSAAPSPASSTSKAERLVMVQKEAGFFSDRDRLTLPPNIELPPRFPDGLQHPVPKLAVR